ncbi:MAG: DNA cytosine methyltransferase [Gammaproteobacteria bacterium]|nr:DNA cytosine methyltransferase [Gammaproteobacteria bacterium]
MEHSLDSQTPYTPRLGLGETVSSAKLGAGLKGAYPAFLEFFAGSGLVAEGLKDIFQPVWANDICARKAAVYSANHGIQHFHLGSITNVKGKDLPYAPLAWASFPCQDLSLAGITEGIHASRSGLVWEWLRIIDEMPKRPPVLVAENVAGLVSAAGGSHYRALHRALAQRGYVAGAMLIDASHWVPQSRPRVFVVAVEAGKSIPQELISTGPTWLHPEVVRKATVGLHEGWVWWAMPDPPVRNQTLTDIIEWDAVFASPETEERNIRLISPRHAILLNATPKSRPFVAPGYKRTRNGKQVLELRFDDLAGCLRTPEGGSSRQVLVIRKNGQLRSRLLTVREAARLMGAPDSYKIPGSYNDGYRAMGDAVAVPVARWLARKLLLPLVLATNE